MSKKTLWFMLSLLTAFVFLLTACGGGNTGGSSGGSTGGSSQKLAVGIVLPTKDEPRWIQDETRFREALQQAGYQVEILFSQGSDRKSVV